MTNQRLCADAGKTYPIKVTFSVEIPGLSVAETRTTSVDCKHECTVVVPADGAAYPVRLMPNDVCQPKFLLVRPISIDGIEVKKPEDLLHLKLHYATVAGKDGDAERDRKPIEGTHVFANGMAEWVTDMTDEGKPGPLTKLHFWNATQLPVYETDEKNNIIKVDGKPKQKVDNGNPVWRAVAVGVLVFVGYSPIPKSN